MPLNNMTVGNDLSFTLVTPLGALTISGVTDYSTKKKNSTLTSKRLTGKMIHAVVPDGWEITIRLDRKDPTLDRYFANYDASYYAGVNIQNGTIYETIKESDGSLSQYRYTEVALSWDGAGDFKGDSFIPISLTAMATERLLVA